METKLDWGVLASPPLTGNHPALNRGRVLFVERNGKIEFPTQNTTVWPLSSITTVGWLNTAPTHFRVNIPNLTSKDAIPCCAVVYFEVELKHDVESKIKAATSREALYDSFVLIARNSAQIIFKKYDYLDLLLLGEEARKHFTDEIKNLVQSSTPYIPRTVVLDGVAALDSGIDEELRRAHAADITVANTQRFNDRQSELDEQERKKRHQTEDAEVDHQLRVQRKREEAERISAAEMARQRTDLEIEDARKRVVLEREQAEWAANQRNKDALEKIGRAKMLPSDITENQLIGAVLVENPDAGARLIAERFKNQRVINETQLEMVKTVAEITGASLGHEAINRAQEALIKRINIHKIDATGNAEDTSEETDEGNLSIDTDSE